MIDIPEEALTEAIRHAGATTKRRRLVRADLEMRRWRLVEWVGDPQELRLPSLRWAGVPLSRSTLEFESSG